MYFPHKAKLSKVLTGHHDRATEGAVIIETYLITFEIKLADIFTRQQPFLCWKESKPNWISSWNSDGTKREMFVYVPSHSYTLECQILYLSFAYWKPNNKYNIIFIIESGKPMTGLPASVYVDSVHSFRHSPTSWKCLRFLAASIHGQDTVPHLMWPAKTY